MVQERHAGASNVSLPMKPSSSPTVTAEAPHGHQALSAYIRSRFDDFSRSQKDVAQYIVDHLDEAAFQTAEELARRASTSSSTVVRFSQALGFEGFPELQQAARDEYRRRPAGAVDTLAASAPLFSVLIAGTDQMAFFASYLRHLLMLLDLRAEIVAGPSQEALGRLSRIDENTLVIGLSAGRPHPLITRTMKLARHRKAPTLAITDATLSEVARLARIRLYYSSNTPAFVRSHTALLSLIQALAYGVYARDAQQYDVRIKAFRLK
jgi:DNA-binding MurR/RpiR family transcriptional regulator